MGQGFPGWQDLNCQVRLQSRNTCCEVIGLASGRGDGENGSARTQRGSGGEDRGHERLDCARAKDRRIDRSPYVVTQLLE